MTGPIIQVNPDDLTDYARKRRIRAVDHFSDEPPPPVPGDPSDPTKSAQSNLDATTGRVTKGFRQGSERTADTIEINGHLYRMMDQDNAAAIAAVAPGDQAPMLAGTSADLKSKGGLGDAVKLGDVTTPLGTLGSGALQGFTGLFSGVTAGATQGLSTVAGQLTNVAGQLGSAQVKADAAPHVGADFGGGDKKDDDKRGATTHPASSSVPPSITPLNGSTPTTFISAHGHDEDHDVVTGVGGAPLSGGMPAGGLGAAGGGTTGKPPVTKRIATHKEEQPKVIPAANISVKGDDNGS